MNRYLRASFILKTDFIKQSLELSDECIDEISQACDNIKLLEMSDIALKAQTSQTIPNI